MTEQSDKLDLHSPDISEEKKQELLRLFPEIHTEGGKIDLEQLKLVIGETVDVGKERYGMNWPGKTDCFKTIQAPSLGTLRPCPEESVNFDTTENLIIEGDNLEVLKLLQKSYLGKIKMIYIDPPYNTGNDFIYPDNYTESLQTYLQYTGQVDSEGKKFSTNTEADGRFHSKWLNMMYPRLYLARNLLRDDGVIFISIDDNEVSNLRKLCDEIFGEEYFVAQFPRITKKGGKSTDNVSKNNDYLLCYSKYNNPKLFPFEHDDKDFKYSDEFEKTRGLYKLNQTLDYDTLGYVNSLDYEIVINGVSYFPGSVAKSEWKKRKKENPKDDYRWRWSEKLFNFGYKNGFVVEKKSKNGTRIYTKTYQFAAIEEDANRNYVIVNEERTKALPSIEFIGNYYSNDNAKKDLIKILGKGMFDYPKPVSLSYSISRFSTAGSDIILDFFAGSGTLAHAVLELNEYDKGNRKFILLQLPEPCSPDSESFKAGFKTISDICKERTRRVIKKLNEVEEKESPGLFDKERSKKDRGFRVFKLAESNFKTWNADIAKGNVDALKKQLELHIDHIRPERSHEDILYEILLKSGFALTPPIEKLELAGMTVFSAAGGTFLICLERKLTMGVIEAMAKRKPERVVCLDEGFTGNDQLKANAVQIFKTKGVNFKTV